MEEDTQLEEKQLAIYNQSLIFMGQIIHSLFISIGGLIPLNDDDPKILGTEIALLWNPIYMDGVQAHSKGRGKSRTITTGEFVAIGDSVIKADQKIKTPGTIGHDFDAQNQTVLPMISERRAKHYPLTALPSSTPKQSAGAHAGSEDGSQDCFRAVFNFQILEN